MHGAFDQALSGAPAAIAAGRVMHARLKPVSHRFAYRVFYILVDLDRLDEAARLSRIFSVDRANLVSFRQRDHASGSGRSLKREIVSALAGSGIDLAGGHILLLCHPRILGYAFNPLSVYYCYGREGALAALVYEVSNTFGERHSYVVPVADAAGGTVRQERDKRFHVSPFIDMDKRYRFRLEPPGATVRLRILETGGDGPEFAAALNLRREPLSTAALARRCIWGPLTAVKVVAAIHFEALRLWLKGAPVFGRPAPPAPFSHSDADDKTQPKSSLIGNAS